MSTGTAEGKRILIVEDEGIVALDIRTHLEDLGYTVVGIAASAEQAIQLADTCSPDLVLMDIHLQGNVDGIAAAGEIRRRCSRPIVFLTAFVDAETLASAKSAEPYGYLVKPYDRHNLQTTIEMALHKSNADRALREAHADLSAIVGAQRHGTVLLDASRRTLFISPAARRILDVAEHGEPMSLQYLFKGDARFITNIENAIDRNGKRKAVLRLARGRNVDCEVLDDPRTEDRTILVLSETTPEPQRAASKSSQHLLIGESAPMQLVRMLIQQFAAVDAPVLIEGETGTGKELVARAIHDEGRRSAKPFLALNCAGLTEELASSQLFGHRRGAFTGAAEQHAGMFEAAHGGTLFLDEIGELPIRVQTTLLRVLEEHAVMRVGETSLHPVDVRIIAATNRKLSEEAEHGRFRSDLLYRIRVGRIEVPSLRDRIEDLPLLVSVFLGQHARALGKHLEKVTERALDLLMTYNWPGNIRELRNALEYACIRASGAQIDVGDLPVEITELQTTRQTAATPAADRDQILLALKNAGGNRKLAAAQLGISRATFYRRMAQLGISGDE